MLEAEFIFLDCMETLIDMSELPGEREYALWAYRGSGAEAFWNSEEQFIEQFSAARRILKSREPAYKEYDIEKLYALILDQSLQAGKSIKEEQKNKIIAKLLTNYWPKYKSKCYVSDEARDIVKYLASRYRIGIISNFIVRGGVEELLESNGIAMFFELVITSVNEGWRKPHPKLYQKALQLAGTEARKTILIGDDYYNDYLAPRELGWQTILYDRKNKYPQVSARIKMLRDIPKFL